MRFLLVVLSVACLALANLSSVHRQFVEFQHKYGKSYPTEEEFNARLKIFAANLERNKELALLNPKATFGVNKFADMSSEEFSQFYLMNIDVSQYQRPPLVNTKVHRPRNVRGCNPSATTYNWANCGATTPIYNQGQCGSCWAFSATETIESYYFLQGGPLTQLSMEQIVDCDTTDEGCNGGLPVNAYNYVEGAGGLDSYASYPYTAEGGQSGNCSFNSANVVATVSSYQSLSGETGIYQQLSSSSGGPVSVCVDASTWQTYTGGVLTSCPSNIDHCVQAVGYHGYNGNNAYWIVRNSWGTTWGENGYIYIAIGQDLCAIGNMPTIVQATSA